MPDLWTVVPHVGFLQAWEFLGSILLHLRILVHRNSIGPAFHPMIVLRVQRRRNCRIYKHIMQIGPRHIVTPSTEGTLVMNIDEGHTASVGKDGTNEKRVH